MTEQLRILLAEDHPAETEGLRILLEGLGHTVVGVASDGRDAVAKAESLTPQVIFLDIKMPRLDGLEAARQIMARRPVPIILVTGHNDPGLIEQAMVAGVMGVAYPCPPAGPGFGGFPRIEKRLDTAPGPR